MSFEELRMSIFEIGKKNYIEIDSQTLDAIMEAIESYVDTAVEVENELRDIRNKREQS